MATKYPLLAKEWSDRNLPLTPDIVNDKSTKNVWWKCNTCGYEWKAVIKSRTNGSMCPVCADRVVLQGYNDLNTTDPELLNEWDYEKNIDVTPTMVTRNSMKFVWWKCANGHSWKARISERTLEGKRCHYCEKEFHSIFLQLLVMLYANRKGLKVIVDSDEKIGVNLATFIPELNLAIEIIEKSKKKEQIVKEHICISNNIKYVGIYSKQDLYKTITLVKEAFRTSHIYFNTDDKNDIEFLWQWFLEKRKNFKIS